MDKMIRDSSGATESVGKVIKRPKKPKASIDYRTSFCRGVLKTAKRNVDACFLMPLKLYHSWEKIQSMDMIPQIKELLDEFLKMPESDCIYFWLWLDDGLGNYANLSDENWGEDIKKNHSTIIAGVRSRMANVSKAEELKYVEELCKRREEAECWILSAYEMMLRKLYNISRMRLLVEDIITYLEGYRIGIRTTIRIVANRDEEYIFKIAANLMLLVMRLRLGIDQESATEWYNEGNSAYFCDRDQMLEEYILIIGEYSYQSYERFIRLRDMAINGKNKYAAKEVGDVYRLGATLVDYHENRISIEKDKVKAREYYYICVEDDYIPGYIPLVKMEIMINQKQRENLLQQAKDGRDLEGLIYYAEQCLKRADGYCQTDQEKALENLCDAAKAIAALEDNCAAKHVLKSELLLSETFKTVRNCNEEKNEKLIKTVQELYPAELLKADEKDLYSEIEKIYLLAQELGEYEAEYRLGKLFRGIDDEKSKEYFERGREKGCKWCLLEDSRALKTENVKEWLNVMINLDKSVQGNEILQECIAKELAEAENVWEAVKNKQIELERHEEAEIYLVLYHSSNFIEEKIEKDNHKKRARAELQCKLTDIMGLFEERSDDGE